MTTCPACQGIIGPHKSTDGYRCRCPHNIKSPTKETKVIELQIPNLTLAMNNTPTSTGDETPTPKTNSLPEATREAFSLWYYSKYGNSVQGKHRAFAAWMESQKQSNLSFTATQRIAELESRVKQLEGALRGADEAFAKLFWTTDDGINTRDGDPEDCDADAFTLARWKACRDALSPSHPAVENEGIPLPVATIDLRTGDVVDEAPPVQTEEKPATFQPQPKSESL